MKTAKLSGWGAIGLVVALAAALMAPQSAMAQGKGKDKPGEIPAAARKEGMAEAPAVVQAAGLTSCTVSDARKIGEDKKTKKVYYEVACGSGAMGYVLEKGPESNSIFSCIEANTPPAPGQPPSAPCILPGNANPAALLVPLLKASNVDCVPTEARGIGQTKSNTYLEVACPNGAGYILLASAPLDTSKPLQAQNCLMYDEAETNIKCKIGDHATRLMVIDKYVTAANNGCVVKDRRFVGLSKDGATFYEASCNDGKGYIYKVAANGSLDTAYDCAKASQILGGCTLTDARQAQNEQAGLYTKLAQKAGSKCEVDRYALFPPKPGEEDVEMVCKDGTGAIGIFKAGGNSVVLDCGRAPIAGFKCSLSKDTGYTLLTSDLKKFKSDTTCEVSNSRVVGKTDKGTTYMEVACADKLKGYIIEYQSAPSVQAVNVTGCALTGGQCKLPGNT